jgi:hypothetical protein
MKSLLVGFLCATMLVNPVSAGENKPAAAGPIIVGTIALIVGTLAVGFLTHLINKYLPPSPPPAGTPPVSPNWSLLIQTSADSVDWTNTYRLDCYVTGTQTSVITLPDGSVGYQNSYTLSNVVSALPSGAPIFTNTALLTGTTFDLSLVLPPNATRNQFYRTASL